MRLIIYVLQLFTNKEIQKLYITFFSSKWLFFKRNNFNNLTYSVRLNFSHEYNNDFNITMTQSYSYKIVIYTFMWINEKWAGHREFYQ